MYIYRCVRQPGLALEFISVNGTGDAYRCLQCTHLRKKSFSDDQKRRDIHTFTSY